MLIAVCVFIGLTLCEGVLAKLLINKWQRQQYAQWGWNRIKLLANTSWLALSLTAWLSPVYSSRSPILPGGAVFFLGSMLIIWAVRVNPYFVPATIWLPRYMLVTSGPYKYLRHPGYTGMLIQACGLAILFNNIPVLCCAVVYSLIILFVMVKEDRLLYPR